MFNVGLPLDITLGLSGTKLNLKTIILEKLELLARLEKRHWEGFHVHLITKTKEGSIGASQKALWDLFDKMERDELASHLADSLTEKAPYCSNASYVSIDPFSPFFRFERDGTR